MKFIIKITVLIFVLSQTAFADNNVRHGFKFNARWDSSDIKILNYRYSSFKPSKERLNAGNVKQQESIYMQMPIGDELYVKWEIKSTGVIHEKIVDLKHFLPSSMENKDIYFIVNGSKLHVYVITKDKWIKSPCLPRDKRPKYKDIKNPDVKILTKYCSFKVHKLYPKVSNELESRFWH